MLDLGINFYRQDKGYFRDSISVYNIPHNNGVNIGLGLGYMRVVTKRGGGPYASLKMGTNWYKMNRFSLLAVERDAPLWSAGVNLVFSIGFKF